MRAKSMILLALSLGCGLVAALGINQVLAGRKTNAVATHDTQPIFVAAKDIAIGDPVSLQMVKLEPWPKDKVPPGALSKNQDVEGRRPKQKIYAGEPVLEAKLLAKGDAGTGATDLIPIGYRVVPVRTDSMTSADLIRPGDRVDLLVHLTEGRGGVGKTMTVTFLRFIKVFAIDQQYTPSDAGDTAAPATKTVSLLVKPAQAELVTLAQSMGKIHLVMRSPKDTDIDGNSSADIQELVQGVSNNDDAGGAPGTPNAFIDFLKGKTAPVAPPPPTEVAAAPAEPVIQPWRMVIWDGDKPRELEIHEDGKVQATSAEQYPSTEKEPSGAPQESGATVPGEASATDTTTETSQSLAEPALNPPDNGTR
jgi:pilus assembly protein CpaB